MRLAILFAVWAGCASFVAADDKPVEIPLTAIWAWQMPGTKDVRDLEPDAFKVNANLSTDEQLKRQAGSLTSGILTALAPLKANQKAISAFAVTGTGGGALREAHAVMVDDRKPSSSFPANEELSVVFFSHSFGCYVHLDKAKREGHRIRISYHLVPHRTKELTSHFALIPVGQLPEGTIKVEIIQKPMAAKYVNAGFKPVAEAVASRVVSRPFDFLIQEARQQGRQP
jgi:hypothetical protein